MKSASHIKVGIKEVPNGVKQGVDAFTESFSASTKKVGTEMGQLPEKTWNGLSGFSQKLMIFGSAIGGY